MSTYILRYDVKALSALDDEARRLSAGTLLRQMTSHIHDNTVRCQVMTDSSGKEWYINIGNLDPIDRPEADLLAAIPPPESHRMRVRQERAWIQEGLLLTVGAFVIICNSGERLDGAVAILRYKGALPQKHGTWFGIELGPENAGEGTSDGEFRKQRFFTCADDCALFVSIFKIRARDGLYTRSAYDRQSPVENWEVTSSITSSIAPSYPQLPFKLEDRVVWVSDHGPENGTIKWIGSLPDGNPDDVIIGVNFDNPVGSGTGRYKGRQLFQTKRGHASLMPPLGLVTYSNFYGFTRASNSAAADSIVDRMKGVSLWSDESPPHFSLKTSVETPHYAPLTDRHQYDVSGATEPTLRARGAAMYESSPRGATMYDSTPRDATYESSPHGATFESTPRHHELDISQRSNSCRVEAGANQDQFPSRPIDSESSVATNYTDSFDQSVTRLTPVTRSARHDSAYDSSFTSGSNQLPTRVDRYADLRPNEPSVMTSSSVHDDDSLAGAYDHGATAAAGPPTTAATHSDMTLYAREFDHMALDDVIRLPQQPIMSTATQRSYSHPLTIGQTVYVTLRTKRYGRIRYIGPHPTNPLKQIAGLQMEEADPTCYGDGHFLGQHHFDCPPKTSLFIYLDNCRPDDR